MAQESSGLIFTLGEGVEVPPAPEVLRLVEGEPLAEEALQALLARLPELEGETGDQQDFRLPAETIRPPRPGETIEQPFPPEEPTAPAGAPDTGPLEVLRYSPEGDVPLAPFLSVTFSQPMVALGTVEQVAAEDVPVRLDPQPEGAWRWVGTQTLLFEPTARFPMATEYAVEVPAGTASATGGTLEDAVRWSFATPPVTLTSYRPSGGPTVREPVIIAAFDQAVDPAAVLETITLSAGGRTYGVRMATEDEVADDEAAYRLVKATEEGRWVAFAPAEPLPAATTVTVNVGPGTPSAEGPLVTDRVQSFTFQTYGPLRVEELQCAWGNECPPLTPWYMRFSNPLDEQAFLPEWITVSPALPDLTAAPMGNGVQITGRSAGRTTYTVTVHAGVVDIFGQTLEEDVSLDVRVGAAYPLFTVPGEQFVVLDPAAAPGLSMY
ncbi:MAG: Ig-like domain-containing protein, partial [Chloroflexi bacterium]|nr:Ig-like domain-containing protein [Chloroflexota bacterium]